MSVQMSKVGGSGGARGGLIALLVAIVACGCAEPRRVGRVEPVLHNWEQPYRGLAGLELHVFNTGSMHMPAGAVFRGGSWLSRRRLDVPAFVVAHPSGDLVVFDTGLRPRAASGGRAYLGLVVSGLDLVDRSDGEALPDQMRAAGLDPGRVTHVVLSHMHFDHTGTIEAFANASIVTASGEKQAALAASRHLDFYREEDWASSARWVEIRYDVGQPYATFVSHHDLLGDGSIVLVDLHGHTPGSQGMLLATSGAPILLTGDAAWVEQSWRYPAEPVSAWDMDTWWQQIWRIKKFVQLVPTALVVPGHDLKPLERIEHRAVVFHRLTQTAQR
jgi:glyoxylase-like metal-dependent hydrolase (beta-lactamase superfamily II)